MTNQLSYAQSLGFFQTEWSAVLFLLFAGAIYFVAPVVGYAAHKRGILLMSLWTMIVKLAIGTFRECLVSIQLMYAAPAAPAAAMAWNAAPAMPGAPAQQVVLFGAATPGGAGGLLGKFEEQLPALLSLAEGVIFLAAFLLFVYGLQKLVRREAVEDVGVRRG
jgi:hypothetical protein